jgi:hypothetical protein
MSPQPAGVVRYGALDVVLRPEAGVLTQPGGVEIVARGSVGIVPLREGDVRARNSGVIAATTSLFRTSRPVETL